ncbi:MAG: hypothetical protein LKJ50_04720 [Clostridiales bacterium]|jgi:hypothetical protein|nr:hypothetical protein [Clostridiales bacterium]MCI1961243.1 hypothetical protein [Clostridiales bacterium]MCI2021684.1 hypothetical protein [Clostridiales bacterium]MCI2026470.1 hypothetical protein [Clostridiales bacterium]
MALKYGIFPGVKIGTTDDGLPISDRAVDDAYFARYHSMFLSNGVYGKSSSCGQVLAGSGMGLIVQPIDVFINGWYAYDLEPETLTLSAASESRTDIVVAQLNIPDRLIKIYVKSGTTNLTRTNDVWELCLAQVAISKGQTVVAQSAIRDTRLNSNLCGIVTGLIKQIDPSTLLAQMESWFTNKKAADEADYQHWYDTFTTGKQSEFDTWFAGVKDTLSGDVAGNLLGKINALDSKKADTAALAKVAISGKYSDLDGIPTGYLTKKDLLTYVYPPGTYYISFNNVSPASFLGGTWMRQEDRFLYGSTQNEMKNGTYYGGSKTKTISQDNLPNVGLYTRGYHTVDNNLDGSTVQVRARDYIINDPTDWIGALGGGGKAMDIMPPYVGVHMWKRLS